MNETRARWIISLIFREKSQKTFLLLFKETIFTIIKKSPLIDNEKYIYEKFNKINIINIFFLYNIEYEN